MMYGGLAQDLGLLGEQVTVIAAQPHYGQAPARARRVSPLISDTWEHGVRVVRTLVPVPARASRVQRLLTVTAYNALAAWALLQEQPYDAALITNPAMEVAGPAWLLSRLRLAPWLFRVHDLYPDIAARLGVVTRPLVIRALGRMENACYRQSSGVIVVTDRFRQALIERGVQPSKVTVLPDWEDTDRIRPLPRDNNLRRRLGLVGRFVVLYGGNIGRSQGLETLLAAASRLSGNQSIHFLIVGEGACRAALQKSVESRKLANITILPYQPIELIPYVYAAADAGIVMLKPRVSPEWIPAKTYSIMASGRPVVAAVDRNGACWELVSRLGCGICVDAGDASSLAAALADLSGDHPWQQRLGDAGRAYAVEYASRSVAAVTIHNLLRAIAR